MGKIRTYSIGTQVPNKPGDQRAWTTCIRKDRLSKFLNLKCRLTR